MPRPDDGATIAGMAIPTARPHRSGIVSFAGVLLLFSGSINLLAGIVALADEERYTAGEPLLGSLTVWGIWFLLIGALLAFAGLRVLARAASGAIIGLTLAGLNAFTHFLFLSAHPAWSITAIAVDGLIIFALTTRVSEFE
jgi:hypothetical protein